MELDVTAINFESRCDSCETISSALGDDSVKTNSANNWIEPLRVPTTIVIVL